MASVERYTRNGTTRYRARWRDPDGAQRKRTFDKAGDAKRFLATVEADALRGVYVDHRAGRVNFKEFAEDWLAAQTFNPSTREAVEIRLRNHVYPVLGSKPLAAIRPSTIQSWMSGLTLAPSYVRTIKANVGTILAAAVDDGRIGRNPCSAGSVRAPRQAARRVEPWTAQRVLAVRDALAERYRITVTLGAGLGLRQGEIFGLSPDDVDFLRGTCEVRRQAKVIRGRQVFADPKGGKTRTVPLPGSVRDALAAHLAAHPPRSVTLPGSDVDGKPVTVNLVVSTRESTAINRNYFNSAHWRAALRAAGVEPGRDTGMHQLRHFFASALLDGGESIRAVSQYLGHSDPGFTLRTYAHVMPASEERTRRAVDAALGESCARSVPSAVPDSGSHA